jgi:hypothetical protein
LGTKLIPDWYRTWYMYHVATKLEPYCYETDPKVLITLIRVKTNKRFRKNADLHTRG